MLLQEWLQLAQLCKQERMLQMRCSKRLQLPTTTLAGSVHIAIIIWYVLCHKIIFLIITYFFYSSWQVISMHVLYNLYFLFLLVMNVYITYDVSMAGKYVNMKKNLIWEKPSIYTSIYLNHPPIEGSLQEY